MFESTTVSAGCADDCAPAGAAPGPPEGATVGGLSVGSPRFHLPPACNTGVGDGVIPERGVIKSPRRYAGVLVDRDAVKQLSVSGAVFTKVDTANIEIEGSICESAAINVGAPPELFAAGSDYLRLTCKDEVAARELLERVKALGARFLDDGYYLNDKASVLGYHGWACGPLFYGERPDGVMVQASSVGSDLLASVSLDLPVHPTRVDLQLTLLYSEDRSDVGRLVADQHQAWRQAEKDSGRMVTRPPRLIDGYGAGDSCLIGARMSEAFGRCYDKHREACEKYRDRVNKFRERLGVYPVGSWRYEVEYKGSQAEQMYERLVSSDDYGSVAVSNVKRWYEDRGVPVPVGADAVCPVRTIKQPADVERSLRWLREAVQPTVARLIEMGKRDEMLRALGLGSLVQGGAADEQ